MKLIKGGLFVFGGLFVMMSLISFLIPSTIMTAKSISVNADSTKLFSAISNMQNWKNWHPVFMTDSSIEINNKDTAYAVATWKTNGKTNKLVFTKVNYPEVAFVLQRDGENDMESAMYINREADGGSMQVQWKAITKLKWYPWEKFGGIFVEKLSGAGYEAALASLKQFIEK